MACAEPHFYRRTSNVPSSSVSHEGRHGIGLGRPVSQGLTSSGLWKPIRFAHHVTALADLARKLAYPCFILFPNARLRRSAKVKD